MKVTVFLFDFLEREREGRGETEYLMAKIGVRPFTILQNLEEIKSPFGKGGNKKRFLNN